MSMKAARGTKRVCQSCGSKFYDLNRDPIVCPMCNAAFQQTDARPKAALQSSAEDDEDDEALAGSAPVEMVSLDEVEADENDIPDLEDDNLDIDDDDNDLSSDETFIEVEDDDDDGDVTGIVSGSREEDEES